MSSCASCNQHKHMGTARLTKSGNDADVTQTDKPLHSQVLNSIRIRHILLQHILLHLAKYYP